MMGSEPTLDATTGFAASFRCGERDYLMQTPRKGIDRRELRHLSVR